MNSQFFKQAIKDGSPRQMLTRLRHPTHHPLTVLVVLTALGLALRLPFFFPAVINWDESTFILMGQSILDGHLPYTELWDNKPPLTFVFFAAVISVMGKSIIGVRIAGLLCVLAVAWFVYRIGQHLWSDTIGFWSACLWIAGASLLPGGQATMTEHVALVPLVGCLLLLVTKPLHLPQIAMAGALTAIASLVRLNLAFVMLSVGLYLTLAPQPRTLPHLLKRGGVYLCSGVGTIVLTLVPYLLTGQSQVWWSSVIVAPWRYAHAKLSMWDALWNQLGYTLIRMTENTPLFWLLVIGGGAGIIYCIRHRQDLSKKQQHGMGLLFIFFLSTEISILRSGATYRHYLIQLVPFLCPFAIFSLQRAWANFPQKPRWKQRLMIVVLSIGILIPVINVFGQYHYTLARAISHEPLIHGEAYDIARYLQQHNRDRAPVYLMSHHVAYWFTDSKPLSHATTHPDNITNSALLEVINGPQHSAETEMQDILCQRPTFIVKRRDEPYLQKIQSAKVRLTQALDTHYQRVKEVEDVYIYQRIQELDRNQTQQNTCATHTQR